MNTQPTNKQTHSHAMQLKRKRKMQDTIAQNSTTDHIKRGTIVGGEEALEIYPGRMLSRTKAAGRTTSDGGNSRVHNTARSRLVQSVG